MSSALGRIGLLVAQKARLTLGVWLVLLVLALLGALTLARGATATYTLPGAQFESVRAELQQKIPSQGTSSAYVVIQSEDGFDEAEKQALAGLLAQVEQKEEVVSAQNPFSAQASLEAARQQLDEGRAQLTAGEEQMSQGQAALDAAKEALAGAPLPAELAAKEAELAQARSSLRAQRGEMADAQRQLEAAGSSASLVSQDGTVALVPLSFAEDIFSLKSQVRQDIFKSFDALEDQGMSVDYSYELDQDVSQVMGASEVLGMVLAFLVLLVTLGTVLAAGLPLVLALIGAGTALGLIYASTAIFGMTATDPVLALMLGLGVGIDYALLILYRFREELVEGASVPEAVSRANATAGHSVFFAGMTNIIALSALTLTGLPFLTVMGLAASLALVLVLASSLTLVPAVLSLLGTRLLTKDQKEERAENQRARTAEISLPKNRKEAIEQLEQARSGWGGFVTRHPITTILATLAVLLAAIIPTSSLRLGLPDGSYQSPDSTSYRAYQTISQKFGEGTNGPIYASVTLNVPGNANRLRDVALDVSDRLKNKDIQNVVILASSEDNSTALLAFYPTEGPSAQSTIDAVHHMKERMASTESATSTKVGLTGQTVANIEVSERISESIPVYLSVVLALCLILMALVFRSILVPLMATVGFLLSTLASFGAVVAVYQWGWAADLFGVTQPGPILAFLPILLIGILFGLSADYQIFIVSGMRDAYRSGHTAKEAVLLGYKQGSTVVTACGIIMVAVFASFAFSHLTVVRPIGFALALGVALDAFLIRTTFIPAAMYLLDKAAWWWPFEQGDQKEETRPRHMTD